MKCWTLEGDDHDHDQNYHDLTTTAMTEVTTTTTIMHCEKYTVDFSITRKKGEQGNPHTPSLIPWDSIISMCLHSVYVQYNTLLIYI